jgi:hypothetical protein
MLMRSVNTRAQLHIPVPGEMNYASLRRQPGPGRPELRDQNAIPQAGPRQYEPAGKRYIIDRNAISYMGWTFQVCAQTLFVVCSNPILPLCQDELAGNCNTIAYMCWTSQVCLSPSCSFPTLNLALILTLALTLRRPRSEAPKPLRPAWPGWHARHLREH